MCHCCLNCASDSWLDHNTLCGLCSFMRLLDGNMPDAGSAVLLAAMASVFKAHAAVETVHVSDIVFHVLL